MRGNTVTRLRLIRFVGAGAPVLASLVMLSCAVSVPPGPPRRSVRIVRDATIGNALASELSKRLPLVDIQMVDAVGSAETVDLILRNTADAGFVLGDVAYFAHQRSTRPGLVRSVKGLAALHLAPIHLLVRPEVRVSTIAELSGRRIGAGSAFSGQVILADLIFRGYQLGHEVRQPGPRVDLLAGVDASFATAYYPAATVQVAMSKGARLLPIDGDVADRLLRDYPFLQAATIPAHTYPGQDSAVTTIGVDRLFVCRSDLDAGLVHDLTRHFIEALPVLTSQTHSSLRLTDLSRAPATPIPLHAGAAQFYRERELAQ